MSTYTIIELCDCIIIRVFILEYTYNYKYLILNKCQRH